LEATHHIEVANMVLRSFLIPLVVLAMSSAAVVQALAPSGAVPELIPVRTDMRALPGELDKTEVLNSNSPEVVQSPGILVSTLSPEGKAFPKAHLDHSFKGVFDIFFHHISKVELNSTATTLYIGVVLYNPGDAPIVIQALQGASYLSQPDAAFIPLAQSLDNADGDVYSGPGDRVMNDVLRGKMQPGLVVAKKIEVPAHASIVLSAVPIPVSGLTPLLNGRSYLVKLKTSGPVQAAVLADYARRDGMTGEIAPTYSDWFALLQNGDLAGPRERPATPVDSTLPIVYGRVAGVGVGAKWTAAPTVVKVGERGTSISFPISSVARGTFGTGQIQSAPLLVREPDTAFAAHGNYGIKYDITLPLENTGKQNVMALLKLQTPIKSDENSNTMQFYKHAPPPRVFFRGTVRISFVDARGVTHQKYTHLTEHQGEQVVPLVAQYLLPKEKRSVRLEFLYPPDATPPQVLTIESVDPDSLLD
jgi:hypothetical protein